MRCKRALRTFSIFQRQQTNGFRRHLQPDPLARLRLHCIWRIHIERPVRDAAHGDALPIADEADVLDDA